MQLFRNARLPWDQDSTRLRDFMVHQGRFQAFDEPGALSSVEEERDLEGALVLPGVVDAHVHFDDPGYTWRETFASGTRAAAAGGVTCVADMPCTSVPPVVNRDTLRAKLTEIAPKAHVDFALWGGVCANRMLDDETWRRDLQELCQGGVAALKVYLLSGMASFQALEQSQLCEVARACARQGLPLGVHAEDSAFVAAQDEGAGDWASWWKTRPGEAERLAALTVMQAASTSGAHLHVVHVGSGAALAVLEEARRQGLRISAETCPHYLAFTREDFGRLGSMLKTLPPVKEATDREALWQGLASGGIAFLTTDHAAGEWPREKHTGLFATDYGGIPGVELLLPFLLTHGVQAGRITLGQLVEVLCKAPARFLGVGDRKGALAPGMDADFVVVEDASTWTVSAHDLHCLNRYTPWEGERMGARVLETWVRGRRVFTFADDAFPAGPGWGRYTRRHGRDHG